MLVDVPDASKAEATLKHGILTASFNVKGASGRGGAKRRKEADREATEGAEAGGDAAAEQAAPKRAKKLGKTFVEDVRLA